MEKILSAFESQQERYNQSKLFCSFSISYDYFNLFLIFYQYWVLEEPRGQMLKNARTLKLIVGSFLVEVFRESCLKS